MSTTQTTFATAINATQPNAIDLTQTQLLGLFGTEDDRRAMLRSADGAIITAKPNDITELGEVMTITNAYVLLRTGATIRRLTVPT